MTTHTDDTKLFRQVLETIKKFSKENYGETIASITTGLGGIFTDFDNSGMKSILPDQIWDNLPENNDGAGGILPKPGAPLPGVPAGPTPIEPAAPIAAADIHYAAMQLNYHQMRKELFSSQQKMVNRYQATKTMIKITILHRIIELNDNTTHTILITNRITNIPDPNISVEHLLQNFVEQFSIPNDAAKDVWQATFDIPRSLTQPFREFTATWTTVITKLNSTDRICTSYELMKKFAIATSHDPRVVQFMIELKNQHPGTTQTWAQMMALATIQEGNLDADLNLVQSAMVGTKTTPVATTNVGGSAAAATQTTKKTSGAGTAYCFIHGTKFHTSDKCKRIKINERAYPFDPVKSETFTTVAQVNQAKLAKSAKFEVAGIGKGNPN